MTTTTISDARFDRILRSTLLLSGLGATGGVAMALVWVFFGRADAGIHAVVQLACSAGVGLFGVFTVIEIWWLVGGLLLLRKVRLQSAPGSVSLLGARMYDINGAIDQIAQIRGSLRVASFFVIVVDQDRFAVWTGYGRPRISLSIPWSEIREITIASRPGYFRRATGLSLQLYEAATSLLLPLVPVRATGTFVDISDGELNAAKLAVEGLRVLPL